MADATADFIANATNSTLNEISNSTSTLLTTSSWFIPRLLSGLTRAILDQANEMSMQQQRSIQNLQDYITSEEVQQQLQDLEANRAILNFNYFVSPYAGVCMVMAIALNRVIVFASPRTSNNTRRKLLPKFVKFGLRFLAVLALLRMAGEVLLQYSLYFKSLRVFLIELNDGPLEILKIDSLLWSLFLTLCLSQFLETFVSIASGQLPSNDTGLTLFEQSLAFQESQFLSKPPLQLLIIISFSLINQLIIQLMGLTNLKKYQLIPSTIMGVSFLIYYIYNIFTGELINFPWVVIFSIIPQLLVLSITSFCMTIYGLAVLINGTSEGLTYTPMMNNLKDSLNLQMNDDFNSVLMRFGFIIFTAVDNEDYVNEYATINSTKSTYLENDEENKSYLLTGYFNKIEKNPELLNSNKAITNNNISKSWIILKRYTNLFKLLQGIFQFFVNFFKYSKNSSKSKKIYKNLPTSYKLTPTGIIKYVGDDESLQYIDNSEDFQYESESDFDPLEYDSETEDQFEPVEYKPTLLSLREQERPKELSPSSAITSALTHGPIINELIKPNDIIQLINPTNIEDLSILNNLRTHLLKDKRLTRSQYAELNQDVLLKEVILMNRNKNNDNNDENINIHDHEHDEDEKFTETPCVVCQTNQRSIILWPCKCFALCETCRVNLGVRGFRICVCCRGNVEGFSKVFTP